MNAQRPAISGKPYSTQIEDSDDISLKENRDNMSQQAERLNETMRSCEKRWPLQDQTAKLNSTEEVKLDKHSAKMRESNKHLHKHVEYVFRDSQLTSSKRSSKSDGGRASAPSLSKSKSDTQFDVTAGPLRPATFSRKQTFDPRLPELDAIKEPITISIDLFQLPNHIANDELELDQAQGVLNLPFEERKRARSRSSNKEAQAGSRGVSLQKIHEADCENEASQIPNNTFKADKKVGKKHEQKPSLQKRQLGQKTSYVSRFGTKANHDKITTGQPRNRKEQQGKSIERSKTPGAEVSLKRERSQVKTCAWCEKPIGLHQRQRVQPCGHRIHLECCQDFHEIKSANRSLNDSTKGLEAQKTSVSNGVLQRKALRDDCKICYGNEKKVDQK